MGSTLSRVRSSSCIARRTVKKSPKSSPSLPKSYTIKEAMLDTHRHDFKNQDTVQVQATSGDLASVLPGVPTVKIPSDNSILSSISGFTSATLPLDISFNESTDITITKLTPFETYERTQGELSQDYEMYLPGAVPDAPCETTVRDSDKENYHGPRWSV